ncbi:Hypothetical predicted protein, partial [Pelobates cultripes]
ICDPLWTMGNGLFMGSQVLFHSSKMWAMVLSLASCSRTNTPLSSTLNWVTSVAMLLQRSSRRAFKVLSINGGPPDCSG